MASDLSLAGAPVLDEEMNSIAIVVKHMAGDMRSRWTDFLTSDEKPDRDRDSEFVDPPPTREALMKLWTGGLGLRIHGALDPLSDADLIRTIAIRGEGHSVMQAINRQLAHDAYHRGRIVLLAKHFRHGEWRSLSVPPALRWCEKFTGPLHYCCGSES